MSNTLTNLPAEPQGGSYAPPQQAPEDTSTAAPVFDFDDAALAEARRQSALEDSGQTGGQVVRPAAPQQQGQPIMVPKQRLDEALAAARSNAVAGEEWRNRALYMEGALATLRAQPPTAGTAAPATQAPAAVAPAQSVESQILAEQAKMIEAAEKFDRGEILATDLKRVEISASNIIQGLREQALYQAMMSKMPVPQAGLADSQLMDTATADLENRHPWTFELRPHEFAWLENVAVDFFRGLGQPITAGNPTDAMKVRNLLAQMTEVFGPWMFPSRIAQVEERRRMLAAQQQTQQQQQPAPVGNGRGAVIENVPPFAQRYAAHPPNMQGAGITQLPENVSEDRVNNMTTEEIMALPADVRARILAS